MNGVPSVLTKIVEKKETEVATLYYSGRIQAFKRYARPTYRDFAAAISKPGFNLIAEFKKASPSKGEIRPKANPEEIAMLYEENGASALSVLTDSHFHGNLTHLFSVRSVVDIPLLRKDFIIDPAQIYEARVYGADAILLIAALLEPEKMRDYIAIADSLKMACLVESHNENELEKAVKAGARIFGINNRDLHTFTTDRQTTLRLLQYIPDGYPIVTESGISTADHVRELSHPRINAMLVGEALMSAEANPTLDDVRAKIKELVTLP
jgi:indole-3-glycerol phosphate synthase